MKQHKHGQHFQRLGLPTTYMGSVTFTEHLPHLSDPERVPYAELIIRLAAYADAARRYCILPAISLS